MQMAGPPADDPWPDWFPFVPHAPVLGEKKPWRSRAELLRRLERDGIIVAKGILDPHECAELAEDMGVWLKRHGVDVADNRSWSKFTPEHLHMSETIPGMMNEGPPCFSPVALKARSSSKVVDIFKILYDLPSEDELVMQLQGLFWNFPPEHYPEGYVPTAPNGGFYHWSSMWMHSDRGRSTVWPPKLQCTLVLEDVSLYDHGFVFLSKSHYYHDEFFANHPPGTLELEEASKRERDNYIQLTYENVKYFEQRGCQWKKVVVPKGSIIIWDSRLIHATSTPCRGRPAPKNRFIVFGGYVPRASLSEEEKEARIKQFNENCLGIDRQIVLELWQRGPPGRLRRLMGLDEGLPGIEVGLPLSPAAATGGGEQEERKEGEGGSSSSGEDKDGDAGSSSSGGSGGSGGGGGPGKLSVDTSASPEKKRAAGEAETLSQLLGSKAPPRTPVGTKIKVKGLDGAWSCKEKEAANALLGILSSSSTPSSPSATGAAAVLAAAARSASTPAGSSYKKR